MRNLPDAVELAPIRTFGSKPGLIKRPECLKKLFKKAYTKYSLDAHIYLISLWIDLSASGSDVVCRTIHASRLLCYTSFTQVKE